MEEKIRSKVYWEMLITELIRMINIQAASGRDITDTVKMLQYELSPLFDDIYYGEVEIVMRKAENNRKYLKKILKERDEYENISTDEIANKFKKIDKWETQQILKILMKLINRKGMYLDKSITGELEQLMMIVGRIVTKIRNNQNETMVILGAPGSGKSYSAMTIGHLISTTLKTKMHWVFTSSQFEEIVKSKPDPGTVIIYDEAGAGIASREFWKKEQIHVMKMLQTFRYLRFVVILTVPNLDFIDKIARSLVNTIIDCRGVDKSRRAVVARVFYREVNPRTGKKYDKLVRMSNGTKLDPIYIIHPEEVGCLYVEQYEKDKDAYLTELFKSD